MKNTNNNNTGGSFRTKTVPFTQVSNSALRDNKLSLKAKGLYGLIQSYITIPNFILYKGYLMSLCTEKQKAFDSAWKELKVKGYLKQYRIPKGENDTFVYEYELLDVADLTTPGLTNLNKYGDEIATDNYNDYAENTENTGSNKDIDAENSHTPLLGSCANSHTPLLVPHANNTACQEKAMPTIPHAERGGNNNTDSSNTDLKNIGFNDIDLKNTKNHYANSNHILSNRFTPNTENPPQKNKTDEIRCDMTPTQSSVENTKEQQPLVKNTKEQQPLVENTKEQVVVADKESLENKKGPISATPTPNQRNKIGTHKYMVPEVTEIVKKNIHYDYLLLQNPSSKEMIDGVVQVIVSTIVSDFKDGRITMGNESVPAEAVKSVFFKLTYEEVDYFIENFKRQTDPKIKLMPYIRAALYKNHRTNDFYWTNRVYTDMPWMAKKKLSNTGQE